MAHLPVRLQHPTEARFTSQIDPFVSEHGHDACRRHGCKSGLVGDVDDLSAFVLAQCMGRDGTHSQGAFITLHQPRTSLPALQGAHVDAGEVARQFETCASGMGLLDVQSNATAIFQADHASAP